MYNDNLNLEIDIAGVKLKNPVMTASGTFAAGREYSEFVDLNRLGAVVVKGIATNPWPGNPAPRIAETYGGILNSIGLQNLGVDHFIKEDIPFLGQFDTKIVVNIIGKTIDEYCQVAERLNDVDVDLLELNISCPNIKEGGVAFGTNCNSAEEVTSAVKRVSKHPLIVKLSPNVTDIVEIAKAVEAGGADGITMINTLIGMRLHERTGKPVIANGTGGLSGPAVKPVAIRMVYEVYKAVDIPIIGMGGVSEAQDVIDFMSAGAAAVAVGTANFVDHFVCPNIIEELPAKLDALGVEHISDIIGRSHR